MTPIAQISIDGLAGAFSIKTSGEIYLGEP